MKKRNGRIINPSSISLSKERSVKASHRPQTSGREEMFPNFTGGQCRFPREKRPVKKSRPEER